MGFSKSVTFVVQCFCFHCSRAPQVVRQVPLECRQPERTLPLGVSMHASALKLAQTQMRRATAIEHEKPTCKQDSPA